MSHSEVQQDQVFPNRGTVVGFAARTRRNLDFVIASRDQGAPVHAVTQLVLSLLGIVVFPFERLDPQLWQIRLSELEEVGWPTWQYDPAGEQPETLGRLLRVLRHSVAHSNIKFSSDSPELAEVEITFWNIPPKSLYALKWTGTIHGDQLLSFCRKFLALVENRVG